MKKADPNPKANRNILKLVYVIVALFLGLIAYMAYFLQVRGEDVINNSYNARLDSFADRIIRGKILASDGTVLAETQIDGDGNETRVYPYGSVFDHAVGYSTKGKTGIESLANFFLLTSHVNLMEQALNQMSGEKNLGDNVYTTLDPQLQQAAWDALGDRRGAVIAMEPDTGKILAMVSKPGYDPNTIAADWETLTSEENDQGQLLNRVTQGMYPPGSTFKTAQALTFLQEGIIHEDYPTFPCAHGFNHKGLHVGCHGHGSPLSLIPAIATSCNSYFCWGLYRMFGDKKYGSPQNAITVWKDHMVSQGFGYRLGTDLPGEQRGLIPNAKFYDKAYRGSWNGLTVISIAIGQGEILATPLQIANLGATIANRGHFITPHIVKEIQDNELDSIYRNPRYPTIDREYYEMVVKGMRAAVDGSTGSATCRMAGAILPGVEVCGKTGTAQNRGKDHSVFMGFAPMDNPKIAIAVYVENGGFGATYGVPIGAMMMDQYLHGKLSPENEIRAEEFSNRVILYGDEER